MTNDEKENTQSGRRSIRDIPIPRRRTPSTRVTDGVRPKKTRSQKEDEPEEVDEDELEVRVTTTEEPELPDAEREENRPREVRMPTNNTPEAHLPPPRSYRADRSRRPLRRWFKVLLAAVPVAVIGWLFTWHSATVTITEKRAEKEIRVVVPLSISGDSATGTIAARAATVTDRAEKILPATGEATVQAKAGGTITIVNEYSNEAQTLVRNTRFETPDGLIFRVQEPVTVPGKTQSGGGEVQVSVLADDVGESYNVGPVSRFSIPGFSGKPQFDSFYARSESPMSGGFDGVRKVADPDRVADAVDELTSELEGRAAEAASAAAGEGEIAFLVPNSFVAGSSGRDPEGDQVTVWVESSSRAYLVSAHDLSDIIAKEVIPGYRAKGESRVENLDSLRITPQAGSTSSLEIIGVASVIWTVDLTSLESSLLGLPITAFDQVVARYGGIERATPVVRPFWRSNFPSELDYIESKISE